MTTDVHVWDLVAAVLEYPEDASYIERIEHCAHELRGASASHPELQRGAARLAAMREEIARCGTGTLQERYTAAFDFDPACSLDIGWHLFSDGPDRGPWLAALREDLRRAGLDETRELPDHLTHLLRLIPREDTDRSAQLTTIILPVIESIRGRLEARNSDFVGLLDAVLCLLATRHRKTEVMQ